MKTVYILGAGFSAPLGIPVVSNFLEKAKDLYFQDQEKYAEFAAVFQRLDELAVAKNYFATDLFNIEEILSLLEMRVSLRGESSDNEQFKSFIASVIRGYTPEITAFREDDNSPGALLADKWRRYSRFSAMALGHVWHLNRQNSSSSQWHFGDVRPFNDEVAVISLNYDLVLEFTSDALCSRNQRSPNQPLPNLVVANGNQSLDSSFGRSLVKLHGCLKKGDIVPPTWNKHLSNPGIRNVWAKAHGLLTDANHIRVLGYSLPEGDNYIKYLLRSAVADNKHLKSFDVVCLDRDGSVQTRYERFVTFPKWRFKSGDITDYLDKCATWDEFRKAGSETPAAYSFMCRHDKHDEFFS